MVIESEQLFEAFLDLEKSRKSERDVRIETQALLNGLHSMTGAQEKEELFDSLVETLQNVIEFEDAFIIEQSDEAEMTILATTSTVFSDTAWEPQSLFKRVLNGRPIASFNITHIAEWAAQPDKVKNQVASALHIGLHGGGWHAILIVTHSAVKHFGQDHVKKATRFAPLASQALLTLELQQKVTQRDRFFQLSMDLMAIIDTRGTLKQYNDVWDNLLGFELNELKGKSLLDFVHTADRESIETILHFLNTKGGKELVELQFCKKNGEFLWFSVSLAAFHSEQLCYIVARDITDSIRYRQRLVHHAGHDSLTGLKNRGAFLSCLKKEFRTASSEKNYTFAIFFLDLDKFKPINDTLGHDIGDELLKTFAKILQQVIHGRDVVARIGGDEFTILLTELNSAENVINVAERIHLKCATPHDIKGHSLKISSSMGIAVSSSHYADEEAMVKAADLAMYQAKSTQDKYFVISE